MADANKYGGKDSWDDYDNNNTQTPAKERIPTLPRGSLAKDSDDDSDDDSTPSGLEISGSTGSRSSMDEAKIVYRKKIPF